MTVNNSINTDEREKFIPSPSRVATGNANPTAVEVFVGNSSDNPIPVDIIGCNVNDYGTLTALASSTKTTIVSHTVPSGMTLKIKQVQVSGSNVATYTIEVDSTEEAKKRTYFTEYNAEFDFHGFEIGEGSVVDVKVIHSRPSTGDFEARILGIES